MVSVNESGADSSVMSEFGLIIFCSDIIEERADAPSPPSTAMTSDATTMAIILLDPKNSHQEYYN